MDDKDNNSFDEMFSQQVRGGLRWGAGFIVGAIVLNLALFVAACFIVKWIFF